MTPEQIRAALEVRQELDVLRDQEPLPAQGEKLPEKAEKVADAVEAAKKNRDPLSVDAQLSAALFQGEPGEPYFRVTRGFEPWKGIRGLPGWAQAALLVLVVIAFANAAVVAPNGETSALRSSMALVHLLFALGVAHLVSVTDEWRNNAP